MRPFRPFQVFVLLLVCACSRPVVSESFVRADEAEGGIYTFEFNVYDSLSTCDLKFYTRNDAGTGGDLRLDVKMIPPKGPEFVETVYFKSDGGDVQDYRSGVVPGSTGRFIVSARVGNAPENFRGLGLICKENGTR